jgi:uncharacterized protein YuzE
MKINYYTETDSLYIDLKSTPSVRSVVVSDGVVLDYDETDTLVGIDIDQARKNLDFKELIVASLPKDMVVRAG